MMPETAEERSQHPDIRDRALPRRPTRSGPVKARLIKKLLPARDAAPDKVMLPKGPNR
ncbi:MAG: hypothetical protein ACR2MW_06175 [Chthoniobacterales bacterium]